MQDTVLADLGDAAPVDPVARRGLLMMAAGFGLLALLWVVPSLWLAVAGVALHGLGLWMLRTGPAGDQARLALRIWAAVAGLVGVLALSASTLAIPLPGEDLVLRQPAPGQWDAALTGMQVVGPAGILGVSALAVWRFAGRVGRAVAGLCLAATAFVLLAPLIAAVAPPFLVLQLPIKLYWAAFVAMALAVSGTAFAGERGGATPAVHDAG